MKVIYVLQLIVVCAGSVSDIPEVGVREHPVRVTTPRGTVEGFHHNLGNDTSKLYYGEADVFLAVPFAQPPLGKLRFKLPHPVCSYGTVVNATQYPPRCPQVVDPNQGPPDAVSEDCLYLNVYTPKASNNVSYAVMVYIPGGGFVVGGADMYRFEGAIRNLVNREVVVVVMQYRISMQGFFTTYTDTFPPNRGYFDMLMALNWVQEEIAYYGGDPKRVTIFGESSGGAAVSTLSLSPLSRGLFHGIIQESGNVLIEVEPPEPTGILGGVHQDRAQKVCDISNATWVSSPDLDIMLTDCLANKTAKELYQHDWTDFYSWAAGIDGTLLPDTPEVLAKTRPNLPIMMGHTHDEATYFLPQFVTGDLSSFGPLTLPILFKLVFPQLNESTIIAMANMSATQSGLLPLADDDHLGWAKVVVYAFNGMFESTTLKDATWYFANGHKEMFFYTYNHPSTICENRTVGNWIPVPHVAELCFIWVYTKFWPKAEKAGGITPLDLVVADYIGKTWTDFAKNFNPGWPSAADNSKYTLIDGVNNTVLTGWGKDFNATYNYIFPEIVGGKRFPDLTMSPAARTKIKNLGASILQQWTDILHECKSSDITTSGATTGTTNTASSDNPTTPTTTKVQTTTQSSAALSLFVNIIMVSLFMFRE